MGYEIGIGLTGVAVLAAAAVLFMIGISYRYRLDRQSIHVGRLPASFDGTRILFLSDVHRRAIPDAIMKRCQDTGGVDLVLIGGDLREKGVPLERSRDNVRKLRAIAPVYMVYGNHDYDEDIRAFDVMLRDEGVRVLVNESVVLEQGDGSLIRLIGVDDPRTGRDRLKMAVQDMEGEAEADFTILLAHDPIIVDKLQPSDRIDLVFSGHTHGGQISLPIVGAVLRSPYCRGWYTVDHHATTGSALASRLFVSCGFGTSRMPLRLGAPAEYHLFTLRRPAAAQGQ
ncbi:metallophosphoesterase [Paenibacillus spongiae]|uniref:Metallophosphoesterase n=1 Tax=Paenibacillus spongiae TaxID=2909671 RepID=A0ABY5SEG7_9BACL|nr:metallophosphoesterase [Paenibacillus spongiae]UVI32361.1 metallophosphoesterase [Paenibacillus spongiae]